MSFTFMQPPTEVLTNSSPENPACRRSSSISPKYRRINGFSDASIAVVDARRYSRKIGINW